MTCSAVIANTGFELISECLAMGIKVLTKPLHSQIEQLSNGAALEHLGYARVVKKITTAECRHWLETAEPVWVTYPKVHRRIAAWLARGQTESLDSLSEELWRKVATHRGKAIVSQPLAS